VVSWVYALDLKSDQSLFGIGCVVVRHYPLMLRKP